MADLKAHARFFDLLVEAVPAKYYLDAGEEKVRRECAASPSCRRLLAAARPCCPPRAWLRHTRCPARIACR